MTIKSIQYSESIESVNDIGLKRWMKVGMEASLEESDNPDFEMHNLRKSVKDLCNTFNPQITIDYSSIPGHPLNEQLKVSQVDSREEKIKSMFITISECRTVRNLEMFANEVQRLNEPSLFEAYNNKKKELQ